MGEAIRNRYDFVVLFDVENGNPNGDPDAGNMPRIDPETGYGLVTDVCLKRKIRNYVETLKEDTTGYKIYIKDNVPLNRSDLGAFQSLGIDEKEIKNLKKTDPMLDVKVRDFMCQNFYDIRTFGAVMTTFVKANLNCGQVRGPDLRNPLIRFFHRRSRLPEWQSRRRRMLPKKERKWEENILFRMVCTG